VLQNWGKTRMVPLAELSRPDRGYLHLDRLATRIAVRVVPLAAVGSAAPPAAAPPPLGLPPMPAPWAEPAVAPVHMALAAIEAAEAQAPMPPPMPHMVAALPHAAA
jgi:hypothetical protein